MEILPEIPKLYTALAEWLTCQLFIFLLPKRSSKVRTVAYAVVSLVLLCAVQYAIGVISIYLWIPGMVLALMITFANLLLSCSIPLADAGFYWAIAFICAEFMASLEWQVYCIAMIPLGDSKPLAAFFLVALYGGTTAAYYRMEQKKLQGTPDLGVSKKETLSAILIAVGAFLISNISYISTDTPLSGNMSMQIFYIRTLVDFAGVIMIYSLQDRLRVLQITQELDAIDAMFKLQYEQYQQSRDNIELINRKYHDLKHQISVIRMEPNEEKREEYLMELESGVQRYDAENKTGNPVLDTIITSKQIYCQQHDIHMTVVADGARLGFMETMDICSIFGNALDNAIESVETLADSSKRLIRVSVSAQNVFLLIRVENYFESAVRQEGGEFKSTKKSATGYHGFGIKSIRYAAEKYGGSVSITAEANWFNLRLLIPLPQGVL